MNKPLEEARFGRKADACRILACGPTYLSELRRKGKLTPIRLGRRMTVYDLREVHALADQIIAEARATKVNA